MSLLSNDLYLFAISSPILFTITFRCVIFISINTSVDDLIFLSFYYHLELYDFDNGKTIRRTGDKLNNITIVLEKSFSANNELVGKVRWSEFVINQIIGYPRFEDVLTRADARLVCEYINQINYFNSDVISEKMIGSLRFRHIPYSNLSQIYPRPSSPILSEVYSRPTSPVLSQV